MKTEPNDPANNVDPLGEYPQARRGFSKREYFAAMAMQGLCANECTPMSEIAFRAVEQADALIAALNKEPKL